MRTDYLFVARSLRPLGGEEALVARCLECLLQRGTVTVLTSDGVDLEGLDRMAGTRLAAASFDLVTVGSPLLRALSQIGIPTRLLNFRLLLSRVRKCRRPGQPCLSVGADLDLGDGEGVWQYLAASPRFHSKRLLAQNLDGAKRWPLKMLVRANLALCDLLIPCLDSRTARQLTATASDWIGEEFESCYGRPADLVLHPPPLGLCQPPEVKRIWGFVGVSRAEPGKGWMSMIEVVSRLRQRGHPVSFTMLCLGTEEDALVQRLRAEVTQSADWLRLELNAPRDRLDQALRDHSFGLHLAQREGYGMAVAEMLLAGCLTGVSESGGQTEIVTEPELRFADLEDAVEKWHRILSHPELRERLLASQQARRSLYTRETFEANFHHAIDDFEARLATLSYSASGSKVTRR